jgi:hypothetical protein
MRMRHCCGVWKQCSCGIYVFLVHSTGSTCTVVQNSTPSTA